MHLVNFALMSEEAAGICEALELFAARLCALIWSIVLVHVFAKSC
jgi:hypothetical protein